MCYYITSVHLCTRVEKSIMSTCIVFDESKLLWFKLCQVSFCAVNGAKWVLVMFMVPSEFSWFLWSKVSEARQNICEKNGFMLQIMNNVVCHKQLFLIANYDVIMYNDFLPPSLHIHQISISIIWILLLTH